MDGSAEVVLEYSSVRCRSMEDERERSRRVRLLRNTAHSLQLGLRRLLRRLRRPLLLLARRFVFSLLFGPPCCRDGRCLRRCGYPVELEHGPRLAVSGPGRSRRRARLDRKRRRLYKEV
jgi:hypothetical protein